MKVKFYGGPLDGAEMSFVSRPPYEWCVPKPSRVCLTMESGDFVPVAVIPLAYDTYRIVSDPWRGAAYCFVGGRK